MLQQGLGTLDSRIDKKADVLRANPQAMGQAQQKQKSDMSKGITPDLMNALVLQKIASEKQMAENQLKLSMEQNPATVVDQLEQNVIARTKDDLVKQTAGIMGERDKKRRQQMSMAKPPQQRQRPPMPQGASAGLRAAPRPPMQMANGGIVGYNKGDKVEAKKEEMPSGFSKMFGDVVDWAKENPVEAVGLGMIFIPGIGWAGSAALKAGTMALKGANVLYKGAKSIDYGKKLAQATNAAKQAPSAAGKLAAKTVTRPSTSTKNVVDGVSKGIGREYSAGRTAATGAGIYGIGKGLGALDQKISDDVDTSIAKIDAEVEAKYAEDKDKDKTIADMGGSGVLRTSAQTPTPTPTPSVDQQLQDVLDTPAPDTSGIDQTQLSTALGDEFMGKLDTRMDINPIEERDKELARLASDDSEKGGYGIKKYQTGLANYLKRQEEEDARQLDPEALEKARAEAGVRGLIEGGTGRGASIARGKFDQNVAKRRRDIITEQRNTYVDNETKKNAVIKDINTDAAKLFDTYTKDVAAAMNTMANVTKGDLEMYQKEADRMYQNNQNGIKNKIDAIRVSGEARLRELIQTQASLQDIARAISDLKDKNNDLRTQYEKALQPEMQRLNSIVNDRKASKEKVKLARDQLIGIESTYQELKDKTKTDEFIEIYKEFLLQLKAQGGYTNQFKTQIEQVMKNTLGKTSATQTGASAGSAQARANALVPLPSSI